MKLLLLFLPLFSLAQSKRIGAGATLGFSSRQATIAEMYVSAKVTDNIILTPIAIRAHLGKSNPTLPRMFETRIAYNVNSFEFFTGMSYHIAGMDGIKEYSRYKGLFPCLGAMVHFRNKFLLTSEMSHNIFSVGVGVFGFK